MCCDNSRHLLKYFFGIYLCSILNPLLHVSNLLENCHFLIFSLFCYHSNCKSRINTRLLHFGYCSNKLIRRNLWRATFIFWPQRGAKIASWCVYPFSLDKYIMAIYLSLGSINFYYFHTPGYMMLDINGQRMNIPFLARKFPPHQLHILVVPYSLCQANSCPSLKCTAGI